MCRNWLEHADYDKVLAMASKTPIIRLGAASLLLAGCATGSHQPAPAPTPPPARLPAPVVLRTPSSTPPRPTASAKPKPPAHSPPPPAKPTASVPVSSRAALPSLIGHGASWNGPDYHVLNVQRGTIEPQQPVPIFRQASALASVRAALADSSKPPQAEFRHGLLTLTFDQSSNNDIAEAVKKTLTIPEARNLQVILP